MIIKEKNGLSFELEQKNYTAKIIYSPDVKGDIFIPRSINYQNNDYIITDIQSNSFKCNDNLISITFADDSQLRSIGRKAFSYSSIETLSLPSTVYDLKEGWCAHTSYLYHIILSPDNKCYKYYDDTGKIIVGRSDLKQEDYDVLVFASRDVKQAFIPSNIKHINSFAFSDCNINEIKYEKNTKLETIDVKAFNFNFNFVNKIFIPNSVKLLKDGWLDKIHQNIEIIISSENKNYKYINNDEILARKSDPTKDDFDVIVFAKQSIQKVFIPKNVKYIGSNAFANCSNLSIVQFEEGSQLISIGKKSFQSTQINSILIPASVRRIEKDAFFDCGFLRIVDIPNDSNLCSISKRAFFNTKINKINIPSNVKELKNGWCIKTNILNNISLDKENQNFAYLAHSNKKIIVGKYDQNSEVFDVIVFACRDIKYAFIPSTIKYISPYAFSDCSKLENIVFEKNSNLQSIGKNAFSNTSLKSISIPSSLKEIDFYSFYNCRNLNSLVIPENSELLTIKMWAFYETSIKNIFIPSKVNNLENRCFEGMSLLEKITISPDNKRYSFIDDDHRIIAYKSDPNNENYDSIVFSFNNIQNVFIPSFIKQISSSCFASCFNLHTIKFDENSQLEIIDNYSFSESGIIEITIPKNVIFIGESAFSFCDRLIKVDFEKDSNLNYINKELFESSAIEILSIPSNVSRFNDNWCIDANHLYNIHLSPLNKCFAYSNNEQKNIILGKSNPKNDIFDVLIFACRNIKNAIIPDTVKCINPNAFADCHIVNIFIPKSVNEIRKSAFINCSRLRSLEFGEGGEKLTISDLSFAVTEIEFIIIPSKILKIENDSFMGCNLKSFEFLGEEISIDKLSRNKDSFIASFPNAHKIDIRKLINKDAVGNIILFITNGVKIVTQ